MSRASVLLVASDPARSVAMAGALARLGLTSNAVDPGHLSDEADDVEAALVDASLLDATPAILSDLRRVSPGLPIVLACGADSIEHAATALNLPGVAFLYLPASDADYALSLASIRTIAPSGTMAEGDAGYALRLAALGEEIARIARAIEPPAPPAHAPRRTRRAAGVRSGRGPCGAEGAPAA